MRLSPGDTVLVQRPRAPFYGVVLRVNAKSVTVLAGGKMWRVPVGYPLKKSTKERARLPAKAPRRATASPRQRRSVHADERYYMDGERTTTRRGTTYSGRKTRMIAMERAAGTPPPFRKTR